MPGDKSRYDSVQCCADARSRHPKARETDHPAARVTNAIVRAYRASRLPISLRAAFSSASHARLARSTCVCCWCFAWCGNARAECQVATGDIYSWRGGSTSFGLETTCGAYAPVGGSGNYVGPASARTRRTGSPGAVRSDVLAHRRARRYGPQFATPQCLTNEKVSEGGLVGVAGCGNTEPRYRRGADQRGVGWGDLARAGWAGRCKWSDR